ncbi:PAAR domain-containing protein [Stenotrophomonas sp. 24(2023)]|uniref:PAAR domain-containing protein n=1 Tax=Stenotrophomonas sp. 24(2023) TaxID=3068324 RepID=UPI0027E01406|nr:PAAR domain-containing protein [Stenotrophomonas sp. 24(2023)]WMJ68915.1 PAAR domain-containing protein [Stenotrophomonas sp. 24(2023)]
MKMIIVEGDRHSGGGAVITGSATTDIDGKPVARIGDKATCPKHTGVFSIVTGDPTWIIDGNAVARHGDTLACGCSLESHQQHRVLINSEGDGTSMTGVSASGTTTGASLSPTVRSRARFV